MDPTDQQKIRASNIRAVWEALLAPKWSSGELIDLGKAIYARIALKDLDPTKFDKLLPRLAEIVERLEGKFTPHVQETSSPTPETAPGVTGANGPGPCPVGPPGVAGSSGSLGSDKGHPAILHTKEKPAIPPPQSTPNLKQE